VAGPKKRTPEGEDVNWVTKTIGWPFPTWIEPELYKDEFHSAGVTDEEGQLLAARLLINMFNYLGTKIDKALATAAADVETIEFKYWRKLSDKATKMKPTKLRATLFMHPDYGKEWLYVERA
jgi:hypothetical protein